MNIMTKKKIINCDLTYFNSVLEQCIISVRQLCAYAIVPTENTRDLGLATSQAIWPF